MRGEGKHEHARSIFFSLSILFVLWRLPLTARSQGYTVDDVRCIVQCLFGCNDPVLVSELLGFLYAGLCAQAPGLFDALLQVILGCRVPLFPVLFCLHMIEC